MSSTNVVNYSLRQNKAIERSLVFDCLKLLLPALDNPVYVGFGSVWFSDFHLAHRELGIETLISIEADDVVFKRAEFNRPYRTVEVIKGMSHEVMPYLTKRSDLRDRSWIAWLDYDRALDEPRVEELRALVTALPANSVLLATFNATGRPYGSRPNQRPEFLRGLLGGVVPVDLSVEQCTDDRLASTLVGLVIDALRSHAITIARPGQFDAFCRLAYRDSKPMATVGVLLTEGHQEEAVQIQSQSWPGFIEKMIDIPPLTNREVGALLSILPPAMNSTINRAALHALGFDLEDADVELFAEHYLRYPTFAQVTG